MFWDSLLSEMEAADFLGCSVQEFRELRGYFGLKQQRAGRVNGYGEYDLRQIRPYVGDYLEGPKKKKDYGETIQ